MNKRTGAILILFLGSIVLTSVNTSYAQGGGRSSISGFVFGPDRRPVADVTVELINDFNSVIGRSRTDGSGRYYFPSVGQGRFIVRARPFTTALMEHSEEVEIAGVGVRGQALTDNIQKDLYLRSKKSASATPFQNVVVYAQEVPREAEVLYNRGSSDLENQRLSDAIRELEKAVAIFPEYFMALQKLGLIYLTQQKFAAAASTFERAVKINDRGFDSLYGLSYANAALGKTAEAVAAGERAVLVRADSYEANLLLGVSQRKIKEYAKAELSLKQAAKIADGSSPEVFWQLALLYAHNMSRYADAARQLELYLEASPAIPNKEDVKKAIKHYKDKARSDS